MKKLLIYILFSAFLFSSCEDYLDEKQSKADEQEIESLEDLELLLDNTFETDYSHVTGDIDFSTLTDDVAIDSNIYSKYKTSLDAEFLEDFTWQESTTNEIHTTWSAAYTHIWIANYIINNVDGMEGSDEDKSDLKAEAHLIKAYKYLALAMKYCLYPSNDNGEEMGLPLKTATSFDDYVSRSTLEETFDAIEYHIQEGLKITNIRDEDKPWRESTASANALAARYYLYVGDFENAKAYAEVAISLHNTIAEIETTTFIFFEVPTGFFDSFWTDSFFKQESQYKQYFFDSSNLYPSSELLALYDSNDYRTKLYSPWYSYLDGNYPVDKFSRFYEVNITGPDVSEMYLVLAECAARNSDFTTCLNNIEEIRSNRYAESDYAPLATIPSSVKEAVQLVVDERRRELPFTSSRWSDIKRINSEGLLDAITLTRDIYSLSNGSLDLNTPQVYTLEPNSRKYARPLPSEVVNLSDGLIQQNTY